MACVDIAGLARLSGPDAGKFTAAWVVECLSHILKPFFEPFLADNAHAFQKLLTSSGASQGAPHVHIDILQNQTSNAAVRLD